MTAFTGLAPYYDRLMAHVDYGGWADFAERVFRRLKHPARTLLDLACGSGALSYILACRGFDVVGTDISSDMLACAQAKCALLSNPPLFLRQPMQNLDLNDTVDAVVCSTGSVNYLPDERALKKTFERVLLFLAPGGVLIFDASTPAHYAVDNGRTTVLEEEGLFCAWRTTLFGDRISARHDITLFAEHGASWQRIDEIHRQIARPNEFWIPFLRSMGFIDTNLYGNGVFLPPRLDEERIFIVARKAK